MKMVLFSVSCIDTKGHGYVLTARVPVCVITRNPDLQFFGPDAHL